MKQAVKNYKKAARALRTFQTVIIKNSNLKFSEGESDEKKKRRKEMHEHILEQRKILNETLGADALDALYWEGEELS